MWIIFSWTWLALSVLKRQWLLMQQTMFYVTIAMGFFCFIFTLMCLYQSVLCSWVSLSWHFGMRCAPFSSAPRLTRAATQIVPDWKIWYIGAYQLEIRKCSVWNQKSLYLVELSCLLYVRITDLQQRLMLAPGVSAQLSNTPCVRERRWISLCDDLDQKMKM